MPFTARDPDVLELNFGGGKASLFGLPFFLVGVGIFAASVAIQLGLMAGDMPIWTGLLFGIVFGGVGAGIMLGRRGVRIDRRGGEIVTWWGLPKPIRETKRALAEAQSVRIEREVRRSDKSTYIVYPVRVMMANGKPIKVEEPREDARSRKLGEDIAKFLQLPLVDASTGAEVTRQHDELDLSLKDRFRQGRIESAIPDVPATLRSRIDFDGFKLQVEIPPTGLRPGSAVVGLVALSFALFAFFGIFAPIIASESGDGAQTLFFILFAIAFLSVPLLVSAHIFGQMFFAREALSASNQGIEHREGWPRRRVNRLPADSIEELFLGQAESRRSSTAIRIGPKRIDPSLFGAARKAIVVRSDEMTLRIGSHLPPEEAAYVLALLRAVLVS